MSKEGQNVLFISNAIRTLLIIVSITTIVCFVILSVLNTSIIKHPMLLSLLVLIAPIAYIGQAFSKMNETQETKDLSRAENERIAYIVKQRNKITIRAILFYLILNSFIAIYMVFDTNSHVNNLIISLGAGSLTSSLYSVYIAYMDMQEVSNFKRTIITRKEAEMKKAEWRKKLKSFAIVLAVVMTNYFFIYPSNYGYFF